MLGRREGGGHQAHDLVLEALRKKAGSKKGAADACERRRGPRPGSFGPPVPEEPNRGGKTDRKVSLHRDDPDNPIRFAEVNDTCHKAVPQWVKCLDEKGKRGNRDARQSGQGKVPSGSGLMRNPSPKAEACGALQGRKKAAPSCESAAFRIRGSPSWARTSDLRINSPSLYRLSYRGIKTANFTEARLECQIFKIIQMLPNVKSEKSNCWKFSLQR